MLGDISDELFPSRIEGIHQPRAFAELCVDAEPRISEAASISPVDHVQGDLLSRSIGSALERNTGFIEGVS
jgi:hypothetical protein